ncbi:MAG: EamA family transporter [bacterium]|nr:EamA family transporter [bacterium]
MNSNALFIRRGRPSRGGFQTRPLYRISETTVSENKFMDATHTFRARLAALAAVLLFSTGGLAIKLIDLPPLALSGSRSLVAALSLAAYLLLYKRQPLKTGLGRVGWGAVVCYFAMVTAYVTANKLTTAANAIFLQYAMPAWVLIFGALWLGERASWGRVVSVIVSLGGLTLFFLDNVGTGQRLGDVIAIAAGVFFAGVVLSLRHFRDGGAAWVVFWGNALTAALLLPGYIAMRPGVFASIVNPSSLGALLFLGVFQMAAAYLLYSAALKHLPAVEVAILSLVEPVMNPVWVYLGVGERPSMYALMGGAVILGVVFARAAFPERAEIEPSAPRPPGEGVPPEN